jgi:hypothetical protein
MVQNAKADRGHENKNGGQAKQATTKLNIDGWIG